MKIGSVLKLVIAIVSCYVSLAQASTVWDESTHGDFSNNGLAPTPVVIAVGSNTIIGTTGNAGQGVDRDYFRITVPQGSVLSSIMLLGNTSVSGGVSFIGIQPGSQVTVSPSGAGVEKLIGLGHYGNDQIGSDLLPAIEVGITGPLPSGTYSIWVQDTGGPATYGFDFVVSPSLVNDSTADAPMPLWAYVLLAMMLVAAIQRKQLRALLPPM